MSKQLCFLLSLDRVDSEQIRSSLVGLLRFFNSSVSRNLGISLRDEGKSNTITLGKGDKGSFSFADAEHIAQTG